MYFFIYFVCCTVFHAVMVLDVSVCVLPEKKKIIYIWLLASEYSVQNKP